MGSEGDLEQIAGMLAHELRNPLASATTNLAVASELMEESDPRARFIERAKFEMDRIRILLGSCLELACARRVKRRTIPIKPLLEEAGRRSGEKNPDLSLLVEADPSLVFWLDPDLVSRSLENLCENALRALGGGPGILRIGGDRVPEGLRITVEDSGPGIPEELAGKVFEPFISGHRGSGLGLAFVRLVLEAHGGEVEAGRSPLGGARFELRIPQGGVEKEEAAWRSSS